MIIMSVDLGDARTGIAASDNSESFAFPKTVINEWNKDIFAWPTKMIVASKNGYTTRIPFVASKEIKEKFPAKTMWLYTGYLWEDVKDLELISYLDVLVDGEFIYEQLDATLKWKGSANQRVIDVQKTLASGEVVLHA